MVNLDIADKSFTKIGRSFPSKTIHGWLLTVPYRELTYPPKMAFWRWFSFSRLVGYANSLEGPPFSLGSRIGFHWPLTQKIPQGFSKRLGNVSGEIGSALAFGIATEKKTGENMGGRRLFPVESLGRWNRKTVEHILLAKKKGEMLGNGLFFFFCRGGGRWKKGEGNRKSCCGRLFLCWI